MKLLPKMMLWIFGLAILAIVIAGVTLVSFDWYRYHENQKMIEKFAVNTQPSKTLVVFFSRSGHTEVMARKIAELTQADILPLQSARDNIGLTGMLQALQDARNTDADITPKTVDLSQYDTVYIGSPVWLYSPAPQVYEFAKNNDFTGKQVILFNSMNSKFEQRFIDDFKQIIEQNGGTFAKHLYVIRGRMGQQMPTDVFLQEVEQKVGE
ncbi:flavodoxin family protein [Ursidibacter sp. B-7004-1]